MISSRFMFVVIYAPWLLLLAVAPVLVYWYTEPTPMELQYTAAHFASEPVRTRAAAAAAAIVQVRGGTTVYRYVEYCVRKSFSARIQRSWVSSSIVWPAPDVSTSTSGDVGCSARSFAVDVPSSAPSRSFAFVQRMNITVNQVREDTIDYPPIPLRILSPEDADRMGL